MGRLKKIKSIFGGPEIISYRIIFLLSSGIAISWIIVSAYAANTDGAERGGAIAVAIAFGSLFVSRGYGLKGYEIVTEGRKQLKALTTQNTNPNKNDEVASLEDLNQKLDALFVAMQTNEKSQKKQNSYIAASSVVGTICWGFGDIIATVLQNCL